MKIVALAPPSRRVEELGGMLGPLLPGHDVALVASLEVEVLISTAFFPGSRSPRAWPTATPRRRVDPRC